MNAPYNALRYFRWCHDVQGQSLVELEEWHAKADDWARRVMAALPAENEDLSTLRMEGEFLFPKEDTDHGRIQ